MSFGGGGIVNQEIAGEPAVLRGLGFDYVIVARPPQALLLNRTFISTGNDRNSST